MSILSETLEAKEYVERVIDLSDHVQLAALELTGTPIAQMAGEPMSES